VFQIGADDLVSLYKRWDDYKQGLGNLSEELWLGNEKWVSNFNLM